MGLSIETIFGDFFLLLALFMGTPYSSLRDFLLKLLFGVFSLFGVLVLLLTQFNKDIFPFISCLFEHHIGIFWGLFIKRLFYWDFLRGGNNEAATCPRILLV